MTIKQIAQLANVSRGTVDRVIHNRSGVSDGVRERVKKIIAEANFQPNNLAKALKISQRGIVIGIIMPPDDLPFFDDVRMGISAAEKDYAPCNLKLERLPLAELNHKAWLAQYETLVKMEIDGFITLAIDRQEVCEKINELAERLTVVTYNTDFRKSNRQCFVGQEHIVAGRTAGNLMCKTVHSNGKILLLTGVDDLLAHRQRLEGFCSVVRESCPRLELSEVYATHELDQNAYRITSEALKKDREIIGIFVAGGGAVGAGDALRDSGRMHDVIMVCFDLLERTKEHLRSGVVDFTIGQEPFRQGYMPVKLMYNKIVLGVEPEKEYYYTHIDIRNKENIDCQALVDYTQLL